MAARDLATFFLKLATCQARSQGSDSGFSPGTWEDQVVLFPFPALVYSPFFTFSPITSCPHPHSCLPGFFLPPTGPVPSRPWCPPSAPVQGTGDHSRGRPLRLLPARRLLHGYLFPPSWCRVSGRFYSFTHLLLFIYSSLLDSLGRGEHAQFLLFLAIRNGNLFHKLSMIIYKHRGKLFWSHRDTGFTFSLSCSLPEPQFPHL